VKACVVLVVPSALFEWLEELWIPKTLNPTIVVMKSAQDGA